MRFLLLTLVMALCGFSALAEDDYSPLHVGDEWTYIIRHINTIPGRPILEGEDHQRIRSTVERDGKTYFVFEQWGTDPAKKETSSYVRKDEKGEYSTCERSKSGDETLWLSFPLKIGTSWKYDEETTCTVAALEDVAIEAKTYKHCYHIVRKSSDGSFTSDDWFAPNIGLVKCEDAWASGGKRTMSLVEFKPGNSVQAEEDYFPLAVGQERIMTAVHVNLQGTMVEDDFYENITETVVRDGKIYFRCERRSKLPFAPILYRKDDNGVYSIEGRGRDVVERIELVFPLKVGATWQQTLRGTIHSTVIIGIEPVEIANTTYKNCYHIRETIANLTREFWIAPALGMVKSEAHFDTNGAKATLTLKEFTSGK